MTRNRNLAAFCLLMLAGACTVGPNYHPPEMAVPQAFEGAGEGAGAAPPGAAIDPATWWRAFGDPELDRLVTLALADNPDIATAASRVRQARLQEIRAGAQGKPTVNATGNVTHVEFSKNAGFASLARLFQGGGGADAGGDAGDGGEAGGGGSNGGIAAPGSGITTYALGFDASWEIDLFGGARRGVEAAAARVDAAVWNQRDAAVTLAAEVADAYFALRLDQQQIAVIEDEIARQRRALEIAGHVAEVGLVPGIDVTRQRASITSTEARLEPLRADMKVRVHALGILIGQPPATLTEELATAAPMLAPAPIVPAGLPSDLLRRRPDVRAAERRLAAATAEIGVAVADLYPRFSLTGMAQLISSSLATLFEKDSLQVTATGAATFPVLDWGRRKANVGLRREDREQAYLAYRKTVLQALRDVEDPLARIDAERRRLAILQRALIDREATARAIAARYETGFVAQDSLLNAQTDVLTAREQIAQSEAQLRQDTASLFKALGGGWSGETPAEG